MALADPQSLPTTPSATDLDRVSSALGKFASSDTTRELTIEHSRASRSRHVVKLTQRKIAADPLLPSQNREYQQSVHIVIDHPIQGFTAQEIVDHAALFVEYLDTTAGLLADIVQGQS